MDPTDIGLFRLAERRMNWLENRQSVLAQNIANASTPGFRAHDLPSFASALANQAVDLATTSPLHLQGRRPSVAGKVVETDGRAPNGNTVSVEQELGKVADTSSAQEVATSLYHKYQSMFQMVLGRSS